MFDNLEKTLMPMAEAIGRNKYLTSIRDGLLISTPLLMAGSFFLLLANLPVPGWLEFLSSVQIGDSTLAAFLEKPSEATFSVMGLFATMGIAYSYARQINTDKIFCAANAIMGWLLLMPYVVSGTTEVAGQEMDVTLAGLPLPWVGSRGIFLGIFCAFLATSIYASAKNRGWVIKMPDGVPPAVVDSFSSIIPIVVTMAVFFAINLGLGLLGTDAFTIVFTFLQTPLLNLGDSLGAMVIAYIFLHLFWFFGINGGAVLGAVFNPILQTLSMENLEYFRTGTGQGHIICQQFQDLFATFGGCGSTLSLIIAMLIFCKSARIKQLSKLALVPGIFNINEPIVFGLPVVMNPVMLIPFMLVPTINIVISYIAMAVGLVPICNGIQLPWTCPLGISGFFATNWAGAVLQILLLVVGVLVYLPFIKAVDRQYLEEELSAAQASQEGDADGAAANQ